MRSHLGMADQNIPTDLDSQISTLLQQAAALSAMRQHQLQTHSVAQQIPVPVPLNMLAAASTQPTLLQATTMSAQQPALSPQRGTICAPPSSSSSSSSSPYPLHNESPSRFSVGALRLSTARGTPKMFHTWLRDRFDANPYPPQGGYAILASNVKARFKLPHNVEDIKVSVKKYYQDRRRRLKVRKFERGCWLTYIFVHFISFCSHLTGKIPSNTRSAICPGLDGHESSSHTHRSRDCLDRDL